MTLGKAASQAVFMSTATPQVIQQQEQATPVLNSLNNGVSQSSESHQNSKNQQNNSTSSVFTDTKTVMKLISTVKRVVTKLKIELHQDYLTLGQISLGIH